VRPAGRLPHHFPQRRKRRIDDTGARLAGVLNDTIEPAVDKENGALARLLIGTGGIPRGKAQATDVAQPTADDTLHRLRHGRVAHANGVVEVSPHERQDFSRVVGRVWLFGAAAIVGIGDAFAVVAARAGRKRERQQQDRRVLC